VAPVTVRVPAKLNLQLSVGPRRADGYHDLVTVFHAVSLYDTITVEPSERDAVSVTGEGATVVPHDGDNLAMRAVAALRTAIPGAVEPVHVTIAKRIPVAAGLAGGSADAAAALVACNELWNVGLSHQQLSEIAAEVGSDVAFAVLGGTAVGRGRGEELTAALVPSTQYHWVLAFAEGQLSTPDVYAALDRMRQDSAASEDSAAPEDAAAPKDAAAAPELDAVLMAALRAGDPVRVGKALSNDLQPPALALFPALRKTLAAGTELGAVGALVSGSGPTCMFLARSKERALALAAALSGADVCRSVATVAGPVHGAALLTGQPGQSGHQGR
jgi:4-diphosphocytidyl-2-C-methyl-D-erythritol kinase